MGGAIGLRAQYIRAMRCRSRRFSVRPSSSPSLSQLPGSTPRTARNQSVANLARGLTASEETPLSPSSISHKSRKSRTDL